MLHGAAAAGCGSVAAAECLLACRNGHGGAAGGGEKKENGCPAEQSKDERDIEACSCSISSVYEKRRENAGKNS